MSKKTYDFSISNVLSNISIKDSFKVAGFATLMLFFISIVLKLILRISLGDYVSYVSIFDLILLVNGGNLNILTNSNAMMSYGDYYKFAFQICSLILLILLIICITVSYKKFMKQKLGKNRIIRKYYNDW